MRELKFRGYNGVEWLYSETIRYIEEDDNWLMWNSEQDDWDIVCWIGQYTGLKDATGREVYEEDIYIQKTYTGRSNYKTIAWIVDWNDKGMFELIAEIEKSFQGERYNEEISLPLIRLSNDKNMKYAGNIYENPELLEVEE